jgi:hypothetical protein
MEKKRIRPEAREKKKNRGQRTEEWSEEKRTEEWSEEKRTEQSRSGGRRRGQKSSRTEDWRSKECSEEKRIQEWRKRIGGRSRAESGGRGRRYREVRSDRDKKKAAVMGMSCHRERGSNRRIRWIRWIGGSVDVGSEKATRAKEARVQSREEWEQGVRKKERERRGAVREQSEGGGPKTGSLTTPRGRIKRPFFLRCSSGGSRG